MTPETPRRRPNYIARVLAILALLGALALVVATIATNGDGDGDETEKKAKQTGVTKEGQRALNKGVWVVEEGDTLVSISEATAIDLDELVELNTDIDPQVLISGQRVSLRPGQAEGADEGTTATETSGDPADEFGDGSVGGSNSGSGDGASSP